MSSVNRLVLVLNASFEAINTCPARRAITMVLNGLAVVEELSPHIIRTARMSLPVPSVIRLFKYRKAPRQKRSVSRKNILLRDRDSCQYCGHTLPHRSLTLDHVLPRSRGGESTWKIWSRPATRATTRKATARRKKPGWRWHGSRGPSASTPGTT